MINNITKNLIGKTIIHIKKQDDNSIHFVTACGEKYLISLLEDDDEIKLVELTDTEKYSFFSEPILSVTKNISSTPNSFVSYMFMTPESDIEFKWVSCKDKTHKFDIEIIKIP